MNRHPHMPHGPAIDILGIPTKVPQGPMVRWKTQRIMDQDIQQLPCLVPENLLVAGTSGHLTRLQVFLNGFINQLEQATTIEELTQISKNFASALNDIRTNKLQILTSDRERHKDIITVSQIIAGTSGGIWEWFSRDTWVTPCAEDIGYTKDFIDRILVRFQAWIPDNLYKIIQEILTESDRFVIDFLRFARWHAEEWYFQKLEQQQLNVTTKMWDAEKAIKARNISIEDLKRFIWTIETIFSTHLWPWKEQMLINVMSHLQDNLWNPLLTPELHGLKAELEKINITTHSPQEQGLIGLCIGAVNSFINDCEKQNPILNQEISQQTKITTIFYLNLNSYHRIKEDVKFRRSFSGESIYNPDNRIHSTQRELAKNNIELAIIALERLKISGKDLADPVNALILESCRHDTIWSDPLALNALHDISLFFSPEDWIIPSVMIEFFDKVASNVIHCRTDVPMAKYIFKNLLRWKHPLPYLRKSIINFSEAYLWYPIPKEWDILIEVAEWLCRDAFVNMSPLSSQMANTILWVLKWTKGDTILNIGENTEAESRFNGKKLGLMHILKSGIECKKVLDDLKQDSDFYHVLPTAIKDYIFQDKQLEAEHVPSEHFWVTKNSHFIFLNEWQVMVFTQKNHSIYMDGMFSEIQWFVEHLIEARKNLPKVTIGNEDPHWLKPIETKTIFN